LPPRSRDRSRTPWMQSRVVDRGGKRDPNRISCGARCERGGSLQTQHTHALKRAADDEVFLATIRSRIPDRAPDGRPLTVAEKEQLADFCLHHRDEFFRACSAMVVEDALYQVRSRDAGRVPKEQDAIDYLHTVMGLCYCDYLLTRDGHLAADGAASSQTALGRIGRSGLSDCQGARKRTRR
jgi:hypothetical protein